MKYYIDYGCGTAVLYTPYEPHNRFLQLAGTCFGIRKSIMGVSVYNQADVPCDDFERLEFNGDIYIWREDGARKAIAPEWYADDDWDTSYCDECVYRGDFK